MDEQEVRSFPQKDCRRGLKATASLRELHDNTTAEKYHSLKRRFDGIIEGIMIFLSDSYDEITQSV